MNDSSKSLYWDDAPQDFVMDYKTIDDRFYVRAKGDAAAIKAKANELFGSVDFLSRPSADDEIAFVTGMVNEAAFADKLAELGKTADVLGNIRVLDY